MRLADALMVQKMRCLCHYNVQHPADEDHELVNELTGLSHEL